MIKKAALYLAVFTGCFFEGSTSLTTSSFAAHRGYFELILVMIIAFVATQMWDWLWFTIGRKRGVAFLAKKPKLRERAKKIDLLIIKYPVPVLLGYRFLHGFRTAVPLAIGMSSISTRKFMTFSLINTILWDIFFSSVGFFFGAFLKANWKRIEHYEVEIMISIVIAGIITGLTLRYNSIKRVSRQTQAILEEQQKNVS
jgi:membrane protein DedA with SNARE-associated domain